jgi:hypothetical protein
VHKRSTQPFIVRSLIQKKLFVTEVLKALAPSAVCVEPMIHSRRTAEETKAKEPKAKSPVQRLSHSSDKERGDLLIQGFWARGTDIIVDIRMTDTDANLYRS